MIKFKKSFLFFVINFLLFVNLYKGYAQQKGDSVYYFRNVIINNKHVNDLYKGLEYFKKREILDLDKKDSLWVVYDLTLIASATRKIGFLNESEQAAVKGLKLLDNLKESILANKYRLSLYNHLGILYKEMEYYKKGLDYYNRALKETKSNNSRVIYLNNIGSIYKEQKQYQLAIEFYQESIANCFGEDLIRLKARALDNLGVAQSMINHPDAFKNIMDALEIRKQEDDLGGVFTSYSHLVEYYKERNENVKALEFIEKAIKIANETNNIKYKYHILGLKMDFNSDYEVRAYKRITDSISTAKQQQQNRYASLKYDYLTKENETNEARLKLKESELENEKEKRFILFYQMIAVVIILLSVFIYYILKSRHKKEKLQESYKTEAKISKKVHDEVANDIYHVMIKLQGDAAINDDVLDDLEDVYNKTRDISKENSAIDVNLDFDELLSDLLLSYSNDSINVIARNLSKMNWNSLNELKKVTIYRVLQELMVNMKKHSQAAIVVVTFNNSKDKIMIEYKDNGIGSDLKSKNGLQNAENRIHSINGTITFESEINNGFKATITI